MKMIDLRNLFLSKLNTKLSVVEKDKLTIQINVVILLLSQDLDIPISGLFLLKDEQMLPVSIVLYIKENFNV